MSTATLNPFTRARVAAEHARALEAVADTESLAVVPVPPSISTVDRAVREGDLLIVKTCEEVAYPLQRAGLDVHPYSGHDFRVGEIVQVVSVGDEGYGWILQARGANGDTWRLAAGEFEILA